MHDERSSRSKIVGGRTSSMDQGNSIHLTALPLLDQSTSECDIRRAKAQANEVIDIFIYHHIRGIRGIHSSRHDDGPVDC